jgi:hypothetical protein
VIQYGFAFCPAWEYEIVTEDGLSGAGGVVIFCNKKDAEDMGRRLGKINLPEESRKIFVGGVEQSVPLIEQFEFFYVMSIDIGLANKTINYSMEFIDDSSLDTDDDYKIPPLWFTKERIPPECIIHSEKILI